jgi:hypothetical protein
VDAVKANVTALLLAVETLAAMPAPLDHGTVFAVAMEWQGLDALVMSTKTEHTGSYKPNNAGQLCNNDNCYYRWNYGSDVSCGSATFPSGLFPSAT